MERMDWTTNTIYFNDFYLKYRMADFGAKHPHRSTVSPPKILSTKHGELSVLYEWAGKFKPHTEKPCKSFALQYNGASLNMHDISCEYKADPKHDKNGEYGLIVDFKGLPDDKLKGFKQHGEIFTKRRMATKDKISYPAFETYNSKRNNRNQDIKAFTLEDSAKLLVRVKGGMFLSNDYCDILDFSKQMEGENMIEKDELTCTYSENWSYDARARLGGAGDFEGPPIFYVMVEGMTVE